MKELHELIKYLKDNGYEKLKVDPDLLCGIIEYFASKQEPKQCIITDVVVPKGTLCECGGSERVALDCTMKPCKHPKDFSK